MWNTVFTIGPKRQSSYSPNFKGSLSWRAPSFLKLHAFVRLTLISYYNECDRRADGVVARYSHCRILKCQRRVCMHAHMHGRATYISVSLCFFKYCSYTG